MCDDNDARLKHLNFALPQESAITALLWIDKHRLLDRSWHVLARSDNVPTSLFFPTRPPPTMSTSASPVHTMDNNPTLDALIGETPPHPADCKVTHGRSCTH